MPASDDNLLPPNNAKGRTARIDTDYVYRRGAFDVWGIRLAILALVATVGWIALASSQGKAQRLALRGPVAHVHAMWEHNCQACHADFTPITGAAGGLALDDWAHAADQNCQQCHAGPAHHAAEELGESQGIHTANCATCHLEHRGRDADLSRVADRHCTVCHADLRNHSPQPSSVDESVAHVEVFSLDGHPRFRSLANDPGRLKFNHALHMTPGLTHAKDGRQPFTIAQVPEQYRSQYAGNLDKDKYIRLACETCHELDRSTAAIKSDGLPDAVDLAHGDGKYYQPVIYERHCRACHPLPYQRGAAYSSESQLPHRLSAQQMEDRVRDRVLAKLVETTPELQDSRPETIPGNEPPSLLTETGQAWVESQINESAQYLKTAVCAKCHKISQTTASDSQQIAFPEVFAVEVPTVVLKHARFDHAAHRSVTCVECHARAYSENAEPSRSAKDLLAPNIETCVRCHSPDLDLSGRLGARHDCVECHDYHGRDGGASLLRGRGSTLRKALNPRSIDQLLN